MRIRPASVTDLPVLKAIERTAGQMFSEIAGLPEEPVAYLMAGLVDGCLQVEQVTVHPDIARRGLGRSLLEHAASQAAADGLPALTLTTFAQVPWNGPYYARRGFQVLDDAEITPGLRAIRQREAAHGMDRWPRVCMRRDL